MEIINKIIKQCRTCGIEYPETEEYFYFVSKSKKFKNTCNKCLKEYRKLYREKNREKILEYRKQYQEKSKEKAKRYYERNKEKAKQYHEQNKKKISERGKRYREKNKEKIKERKRQYRKQNKDKISEQSKQYYKKNQKELLEYQKQYQEKNRDEVSEYKKQYQEKNRDTIKEHQKEYREENYKINKLKLDSEIFDRTIKKCCCCKQEKPRDRKYWVRNNNRIDGISGLCKQCINERRTKRLENDINYKLRLLVSRVVQFALKKNNGSKQGLSVLQKLPYTIQQLRDHLESLWEDWMNWDNYGSIDLTRDTWQIDHKIPCSALPYDSMDHPNFLKCWDLNNLQPMKAIDNIRKSNKILEEK